MFYMEIKLYLVVVEKLSVGEVLQCPSSVTMAIFIGVFQLLNKQRDDVQLPMKTKTVRLQPQTVD